MKESGAFSFRRVHRQPASHPASFCKFLQELLIGKTGISNYHLLNGSADRESVASVSGLGGSGAALGTILVFELAGGFPMRESLRARICSTRS